MPKRKQVEDDVRAAVEDFTIDQKLQLLEAIQAQCPSDDTMTYSSRNSKLNWQKVHVDGHSPELCQAVYMQLLSTVRKVRTLAEVLSDVRKQIMHPEQHQERGKKVKHPDQPVRPLTAFFKYCQDHRDKVQAMHPELSSIDIAKLLSERWQALDTAKQEKYLKRYKKAWAEFQEANAKFLEEHPEWNLKHPKPRQPVPSLLYIRAKQTSYKEKHPELDNLMIQNKLRRKYKKLSAEKKRKWIQKALAAVPDYEEEVRQYKRLHPDFKPPSHGILNLEEKILSGDAARVNNGNAHKKSTFPGAPLKPPRSAFHLFVKKNLGKVEGSLKERMCALGQQWQAMSKKQEKYKKKLARQQDIYNQQLEEFRQSLTSEELEQFTNFQSKRKQKNKKKPPDIVNQDASSVEEIHNMILIPEKLEPVENSGPTRRKLKKKAHDIVNLSASCKEEPFNMEN